jgi:cytochrome oxidase Cu insertion factor (SCO1/SenC/PrrC family)
VQPKGNRTMRMIMTTERQLYLRRDGWLTGIVIAMAVLVTPGCGSQQPAGMATDLRPNAAATPTPRSESAAMIGQQPPGAVAERFQLTDQAGEPFDSASLAGKVWMGSIFFANCPGPCFRENQAIADIIREIDNPDFVAVSLTCDPDNDTPEVLGHYAARFEADQNHWKFLTGDMAVIKRVGMETFKLPVEVGVHSERGVVFDRQGRMRGSYHLLQEDRVQRLKKLIRDVLAEDLP